MRSYEAICVFNPTTDDEKVNSIVDKFKKKIEASGGTLDKIDIWGRRRMPFRLKKFKNIKEGNFVAIYFSSSSNVPKELESMLGVTEEIIRYMVARSKHSVLAAPIIDVQEEKTEISPSLLQTPAGETA